MATKKNSGKAETAKKQRKPAISPRSGSDITEHQFKPGQTGNPDGRPKVRHLRDMLREEISEAEWLEMIYKTAERAKKGDTAAMKLLAEYRDGKPSQPIEADGEITVRVVMPDD